MADTKSFIFRHPRLTRQNSEKIKLAHVQRMSLFLAGCQKLAEASPIPGLPMLVVIAKGIVDTVKGA
jgi:hypothetical protein